MISLFLWHRFPKIFLNFKFLLSYFLLVKLQRFNYCCYKDLTILSEVLFASLKILLISFQNNLHNLLSGSFDVLFHRLLQLHVNVLAIFFGWSPGGVISCAKLSNFQHDGDISIHFGVFYFIKIYCHYETHIPAKNIG